MPAHRFTASAARLLLALAAACVSAPVLAQAQGADAADPLADRVARAEARFAFSSLIRDVSPPSWIPGTDRFVLWSSVEPHADTWVLYDARTNAMTPIIPPDELAARIERLAGEPGDLSYYPWHALAPGGRTLVFATARRTFALDVQTGDLERLEEDDPRGWVLGPAQFSADGSSAVLPEPDGVSIRSANGGVIARVAADSTQWIEIPRSAWSPDGSRIALLRTDNRGVHEIPIVSWREPLERVEMVPYAKAGSPLPRVDVLLVDPRDGRTVSAALPADEGYVWLAGWRTTGREALVLFMARDGKRLELFGVDAATGAARSIVREEGREVSVVDLGFWDTGWAEQVTLLPNDGGFLWFSERDGWRHLYEYGFDGRLVRRITSGEFPVRRVVGLAPDARSILAIASTDATAPYDEALYRVPRSGGRLERLTPGPGLVRAYPSSTGDYVVTSRSTRTTPRAWEVRDMRRGRARPYAEADVSALEGVRPLPVDSLTALAADGVTPIYGVLYRPSDFDPRRRYPVIDFIYAGPFTTVVPWGFVGDATALTAEGLAEMGFIVMLLDARGTPGRSKAFHDATYGRVGQLEIGDHVAAIRQAAATRPYMDTTRVGIFGHSWGGYFALRGMLTAPEFFDAGYAASPGALEEDAIVNEPHMGLPSENPEGYAAGSNPAAAANLRGTLRLMHGTSDPFASLSTTMRMAEALIRANKQFELLIMPHERHTPRGANGLYWRNDVRRFFVRTLGEPVQ